MAYNLLEKFEASYQEIGENNEVNEKPNLNYLKNLFGLSIQEVGVLSIFFHLEQKIVPIKSMEEVIAAIEPHIPNENSISLILHELADRGLIKSSQGLMNKKDFGLSNWLTKAILKNDMEAISRNLPKGLINAALMIIDALYYERSSAGDMDRIEKANLKLFPLFGTIRCLTHSEFDVEILFSILCFELSKQPFTIGMIGKLNAPITWIERTKEEFSKAEQYLIKENLVTMNGNALAMMGDEDKIPLRLTDFAKMQLITPFTTAEEKAVFARASMDLKVKTDSFGIVRNSEILPLNLVFNEELKEEIDLITQLVQPDHFKTYQEEIGQEQTKKGVAMIFSGPPGTGKTSLAHFLAKNSCRDIIPLDISQLLSKWVGDTEKNLTKLFEYYQTLVTENTNFPILLIDEGDSILHQRLKHTETSVDVMNNHLTSTLLKALDTFSGIMVITTNSLASFDHAFLRRFLFKMELPLPDAEAKRKLILEYLPDLSPDSPLMEELVQANLSGADLKNLNNLNKIYSLFEPEALHNLNFIRKYVKPLLKNKLGFNS
jgi:hypothetical protein